MADAVLPVMVLLIGVVIAAYVAFIRWRLRVHRARREATLPQLPDAAATRAHLLANRDGDEGVVVDARDQVVDDVEAAPSVATPTVQPPSSPDVLTPAATLADAVAGITLPDTLSPIIDVAPRPCRERAAFQHAGTDPVALRSSVAPSFEAIGYDVEWDGLAGVATRGATVLQLEIFASAVNATVADQPLFPSAGAGVVAMDVWLP